MRRLARWTLNALTVLSLLLLVMAGGLWPWSYWRFESDYVLHRPTDASLGFMCEKGMFRVQIYRTYVLPEAGGPFRVRHWSEPAAWPLRAPTRADAASQRGARRLGLGRFVFYTEVSGHPLTPAETLADQQMLANLQRKREDFDRRGLHDSQEAMEVLLRLSQYYVAGRGHYICQFFFPAWSAVLLAAVLPATRLGRAWAVRRRRLTGCCPHCCYDLTGNQSGVCPECGSPIGGGHASVEGASTGKGA